MVRAKGGTKKKNSSSSSSSSSSLTPTKKSTAQKIKAAVKVPAPSQKIKAAAVKKVAARVKKREEPPPSPLPGDESESESSVTDTIGTPQSKKKEVGEDVEEVQSDGESEAMSEENDMTSKTKTGFQKVMLDKVAIANEELYIRPPCSNCQGSSTCSWRFSECKLSEASEETT